jgi:Glycosyl transferases group 1.
MENIVYINFGYMSYKNKVEAQLQAFSQLQMETYLITVISEENNDYVGLFKYENDVITERERVPLGKYSFITYYYSIRKFIIKSCNEYKWNYCYVRRLAIQSLFMVKPLSCIKKSAKIFYEWPTVPLDTYDSLFLNIMQQFEVLFYKIFIKQKVAREIVILQNDKKLSKLEYSISNGINTSIYNKPREKPIFTNTINFLGIAHLQSWHGYDRMIRAIAEYQGKYNIRFIIISRINKEVENLKLLSKKLGVENCVIFYEQMDFQKIQELAVQQHIGVGSLGYHRRGAKYDTSIKNKEYCALGLPFISSCDDRSFSNFKYNYKVSANDQIFALEKIIEWYIELYPLDYQSEMFNYSIKNLSFKHQYVNLFSEKRD